MNYTLKKSLMAKLLELTSSLTDMSTKSGFGALKSCARPEGRATKTSYFRMRRGGVVTLAVVFSAALMGVDAATKAERRPLRRVVRKDRPPYEVWNGIQIPNGCTRKSCSKHLSREGFDEIDMGVMKLILTEKFQEQKQIQATSVWSAIGRTFLWNAITKKLSEWANLNEEFYRCEACKSSIVVDITKYVPPATYQKEVLNVLAASGAGDAVRKKMEEFLEALEAGTIEQETEDNIIEIKREIKETFDTVEDHFREMAENLDNAGDHIMETAQEILEKNPQDIIELAQKWRNKFKSKCPRKCLPVCDALDCFCGGIVDVYGACPFLAEVILGVVIVYAAESSTLGTTAGSAGSGVATAIINTLRKAHRKKVDAKQTQMAQVKVKKITTQSKCTEHMGTEDLEFKCEQCMRNFMMCLATNGSGPLAAFKHISFTGGKSGTEETEAGDEAAAAEEEAPEEEGDRRRLAAIHKDFTALLTKRSKSD